MHVTTTTPPPTQAPDPAEPSRRGLAARVSLGRVFTPVPSEFLLIASTALLLTGFGLVMVLSATSAQGGAQDPFEHVIKQGIFAVLGIPLMFVASRFPVSFWRKVAWLALIGGLGGLRDHDGQLSFAPRLSSRLSRLEFSLQWRGLALRVDVRPHETTYSLRHGGPDDVVELRHHNQLLRVTSDEPVTVPVPQAAPTAAPPEHPPGRSPLLRLPERDE